MTDRRPHLILVTAPRTAADVQAAKNDHMAALDAAQAAGRAYIETAVQAGMDRQTAVSEAVACAATRAGWLAAEMQSNLGWQKWSELCAGFFKLWEEDAPDPRASDEYWAELDARDEDGAA